MADIPPPSIPQPAVVSSSNPPASSTFHRFFRKTKGQNEIEQNPFKNADPVEKELGEKGLKESDSGSATSSSVRLGDESLLPSDVYAEGGQQSRFYEPIPEFEGRHRWDPNAEWTDAEETRLIRRASNLLN